jgi:transcription termination factor Rho
MSDTVTGVLKMVKRNVGVLRDPANSFRPGPENVLVIPDLIKKFGLVEGVRVSGTVRKDKKGCKLAEVISVCGLSPQEFKDRTPFSYLTPVAPDDRFRIADSGNPTMRVMDLVAPIGKGTRGLIVSPPKAGKTMILEQLAQSIHAGDPETRIIVLLIDERPEEVTLFRRHVDAEVLASSNDQSVKEHVELVELTLAHIRAELECSRDIVVLVDSITRMGRAFNTNETSSRGRVLSGGMGAGAMEIPRKFFGLARNIEDGGSVTIIATALVDTGSRMDELIFQEFKGTGNSELVLDRQIAESRVFPAVNIAASGTRREENLYNPEEYKNLITLRRILAGQPPLQALQMLLEQIEKYPTNQELLKSL